MSAHGRFSPATKLTPRLKRRRRHHLRQGPIGGDTLVDMENLHGANFDDTNFISWRCETFAFEGKGNGLLITPQNPNYNDAVAFGN